MIIRSLLIQPLKTTKRTFSGVLLGSLFLAGVAQADVAVIAHPSLAVSVDEKTISKIYLGKLKSLPGGISVMPVGLKEGVSATKEFNDKVLGKNASQLKSYWSKRVFTGKGTPPLEVEDEAEMLKLIAANPNMIGFVEASAVSADVKVLVTF